MREKIGKIVFNAVAGLIANAIGANFLLKLGENNKSLSKSSISCQRLYGLQ